MAIIQAEIRKTVAEFVVTEVRGQPTNQDIDRLEEELIAVASSIPTMLGGGNNGHAGMLLSAADYDALAPGTPCVNPVNPGIYPNNVTNANRARLEAEHKEEAKQFQTFLGVGLGLKDLVQKAIEEARSQAASTSQALVANSERQASSIQSYQAPAQKMGLDDLNSGLNVDGFIQSKFEGLTLKSQADIAKMLYKSQQYISKCIKKHKAILLANLKK